MSIEDTLEKIDNAIDQLLENDIDILSRGLNELNLNSLLARYLTPLFNEFNVDSEYNGDQLKPNDRKALAIAKSRMLEIGIEPNESDTYKLTPDIIIHRRNTNEFNHLVLEIKKDTNNKKNKEFDLIKLEHLTIDYLQNHYNYKLGVAIIFGTLENAGQVNIQYFQHGIAMSRENLQ